jgi:hypothetical protein
MVLLLALEKDSQQLKINTDSNLKNREKWCNVVRKGNKKMRMPAEDAQRGRSRSPRRAIAIN